MNAALAFDALESVKRSPTSPLLWQRLSEFVAALGINERAAMSQIIANLSLPSREAQWLRDSAMAFLTRDPAWFVRQATLVDERSAPDAVMTMLALAWHHAVVRTAAHPSLTQVLRDIDAVRLQQVVASHIHGSSQVRRNPPEMRARVAVYTPEIGGREHGGTAMLLNVLSLLATQDVDLHAFTAKETSIPGVGSYHGGAEFVTAPVVFPDALSLRTQRAVELHIPDVGLSLRQRFDEVRQAIDAFAPDVVVVVGFMSPLAFSLYADYPIVGLPIHALPPLAPVDTWLCARPALDTSAWPGIPAPLAFPFPFRFWPVEAFVPVERDALGLPADACVLITVGYRLPTEMASPWREQMLAFVDRHPAVHWVLIGVLPGEADRFPSHPRVHILPPKPLLPAWLAMADIFVNPPRIGGGGAAAMAMEQGVPVLTVIDGDAGDKVGEFAARSSAAYFAQLQTWVDDADARREAGRSMQATYRERLDFSSPQAAAGLMQACYLATESFNQRTGKSSA
jgi:hypothetical protein